MLHFGQIGWVLWPPWKARLLKCPLRNLETAIWVHLSEFIARDPSGESARYQASPGHILSFMGLTRQDLVQDPLLVLDFFRVNGLMDLI
ncbi:hypothetical protein TNCV_4217561 [Trichonephila clavipes]|nr:hypothetical protein TNCV_4217561 [Trichonephila clavipes]